MNKHSIRVSRNVLVLLLLCGAATARAQGRSALSLAGRYHPLSAALPEVPYGKGDYSGMVGLELHEGDAFWQLAVDLAPEAENAPEADLIVTPQVNLLFRDRMVVGGLGILKTYVDDDTRDDKWTDIYYQFALGFDAPLGRKLTLTAMAYYPFAKWNKLSDFEFDELDYAVGLRYFF